MNLFVISLILTFVNAEIQQQSLNGDCGSQKINFNPVEPFCTRDILEPQCQYLELDRSACPELPCTGDMTLKIDLETEEPRGSCCRNCQCWGDPHCKSFSNHTETWILCDARRPNGMGNCPMKENICRQQKDFLGRDCIWNTHLENGKKPKNWIVGLYGSQCTFSDPAPQIHMYSFDGFSIDITMGERGIITDATIDMSGKEYFLDAKKCFETNEPWKTNNVFTGNPVNSQRTVLANDNIRWIVDDKATGISMVLLCLRNKINGVLGIPRLNIEDVIEPLNPSIRKNPTGFCFDSILDRGLTHDNERTENIQKNILCQGDNTSEMVKMAKRICGLGTNVKNVDECISNWCLNTYLDADDCDSFVEKYGIKKTWCAANTMVSKNPELCSENCQACINDIQDFGYYAGMEMWKNFLKNQNWECLTLDKLKNQLEPCEHGIEIEYFDNGSWIPYKAIPQYYSLCDTSIFKSSEHPLLFTNKVRLKQCSINANCVENRCRPEQGFSAVITYKKAPDMCPCKEYEDGEL